MLHNGTEFTRYYNIPHFESVTAESPQILQPKEIKIGLRPHQKAVIHRMVTLEEKLRNGYDISGESLYSRFGILGDAVGVGKSLMVLGHIAKTKEQNPLTKYSSLNSYSNPNLYSRIEKPHRDISNCRALLVVPHILFRQWQDYIETQTTLKVYKIKTQKTLKESGCLHKICSSDVVLISNTLLSKFLYDYSESVWFSRTYIDEADSIYISSSCLFPPTSFLWFISASWPNVLFENDRVWISHASVSRICESPEFLHFDIAFQAQMLASLSGGRGFFTRYVSRSPLYFKDFMRIQHPLRPYLVVKCRPNFLEESVLLPPMFIQTIFCEPSLPQRIISSAISNSIQELLHAGDTQTALTQLGVPSESPLSLIQAVTENRLKELDRLKKTFEFKSSIEYSSPQQKEQSLANLSSKIKSLEEQIQTIQQRIENYKKEICAICFDEPTGPILTPCCSRIFCANCILMSVTRMPNCPLCRSPIIPTGLRSVSESTQKTSLASKKELKTPPKKIEALLDLIKNHPKDKFLVFSRYENPFRVMQERLESDQIKVETVKGNKNVVHQLLEKFEEGEIRVLLLNSNHAGAGLNITSATYVVLWHAMTAEEEKQIIGRAYRMGRKTPLHLVKLVHPDEVRS